MYRLSDSMCGTMTTEKSKGDKLMDKLSIKTYRLISGYSVKDVAGEVKVSEKTIRAIEKDPERLKGTKFETVRKMCEMYGVTTDDILV